MVHGILLNKELWANGIGLRAETRIALLDEKHLTDEEVKISVGLFRMQNWLSLRRLVSPRAVIKSL